MDIHGIILLRTLIGKIFGTIGSVGGGLALGKEGSLVHTGACIASLLGQVKCYMKQLFSGLEHCHKNGVLHRDIKGSNLLIADNGILKIADFGLATMYDPGCKQPMTSRVVTLWYHPLEILLGATYYGLGVDLWSAGCILPELLIGKLILSGRTEVEQLHKIFKLCGSLTEEYWKKYKLPNATLFKPQQPYKRSVVPSSSLPLVESLLSVDPDDRVTVAATFNSEFFSTEPHACDPSSLPHYPPSKELDLKLRDQAARRERGKTVKLNVDDGAKRVRIRERTSQAVPAPEANAEIHSNVDMMRIKTQGKLSKSEKFTPPHQDGTVGVCMEKSNMRMVEQLKKSVLLGLQSCGINSYWELRILGSNEWFLLWTGKWHDT